MTDLPKPPIASDVDLRDFQFMPLDVVRLRDSDLALTASAEGFRAAVMLWCAAWHQMPAGSLPNNETAIARLAGCDADALHRIRDEALHGFVLHSDGRLYHSVVVTKAKEAWEEKEKYRKAARSRWKNKRKTDNATHVKRTENASSDASSDASKTHDKMHMQGTGTGKDNNNPCGPLKSAGRKLTFKQAMEQNPDFTRDCVLTAKRLFKEHQFPDINWRLAWEEFVAYWRDGDGRLKRKSDWPRTFYNRCIEVRLRRAYQATPDQPQLVYNEAALQG